MVEKAYELIIENIILKLGHEKTKKNNPVKIFPITSFREAVYI
jgi:hypothetical protein